MQVDLSMLEISHVVLTRASFTTVFTPRYMYSGGAHLPEQEEIFDVVNDQDQVIEQAPRSVVHAQNLLHRAVSIFVLNSEGELLLQLRSDSKDQYPGCYTSSASGHVDSGEDYRGAAVRELKEELALEVPVEFLQKFPAGPETAFEFTSLYQAITDEPPVPDPVEIASAEFLKLEEIASMLDRSPDRFTPPFLVMFRWYLNFRNAG